MWLFIVVGIIHYAVYVGVIRLGLRLRSWRYVEWLKWAGLGIIWTFGLVAMLDFAASCSNVGGTEGVAGVLALVVVVSVGWAIWRAYRRFTRPEPEPEPEPPGPRLY